MSKLAAEHVKVVLTGDAAAMSSLAATTSALVGSASAGRSRAAVVRKMMAAAGHAMPDGTPGRRFLQHLALDGSRRYLDASTLFHTEELGRLFQDEALEQLSGCEPWAESLSYLHKGNGDWLAAAQHCDLNNYLPLDVLTKVDRMTMAHSIEARPPLLDHHIVEFAATIPARLRLRDGTTKYLFKQAMRGILPDEIIDRPKHGFAVPTGTWFRGELSDFARDLLLSGAAGPRAVQRSMRATAAAQRGRSRYRPSALDGRLPSNVCQRFLARRSPNASSSVRNCRP